MARKNGAKKWREMVTRVIQGLVVVAGLGDELEGEVVVAEVGAGAAADVVLVQTHLGRDAELEPIQ
jgi:hypothetical protein